MLNINNKSLDTFGISKVINFHTNTSNYNIIGSYWNSGSLKPIKGIKSETYRILNTKFLFEGNSRLDILRNISRFIEESKECVFFRDDLYYEVEISDSVEPEILNSKAYMLSINYNILDVYEAEKNTTTNTDTVIIINSPKPCYANLEIIAPTGAIDCSISINDIKITVNNLKANEVIYIGSGKVVSNGKSKINDVDIWEFPILNPGVNSVKVNRKDVNITLRYNERW